MEKTTDLLNGLRGIIVFFFEHPPVAVVLIFVFLMASLAIAAYRKRPIAKDELRGFTASMRQEAKDLAGGRCEHSYFWLRCRTPGGHADHIYPWSKGGWTTMANCQSLCVKHNLQKSAHLPGRFYIRRLEIRRRRYFPVGADPKVDWSRPV
jgi:5-methylcytosine-specific restriction endonuclease McrA